MQYQFALYCSHDNKRRRKKSERKVIKSLGKEGLLDYKGLLLSKNIYFPVQSVWQNHVLVAFFFFFFFCFLKCDFHCLLFLSILFMLIAFKCLMLFAWSVKRSSVLHTLIQFNYLNCLCVWCFLWINYLLKWCLKTKPV